MKRKTLKSIMVLGAFTLCLSTAVAQAPEKMSYQAVVRNSSDALVSNQQVGMRVSILQGSATGTAVYVEKQTPTTNANGLVSVEFGSGTVVSGNFTSIDWANGPYFIKTETDPTGGTNYTITGTSQMMSVPYALYAKTSGSSTPGPQGIAGQDGVNGVDGKSAYQIWLDANNIGSESDFLASLKGADGQDGAQGLQGIPGTDGQDGVDGVDGKSAYQIWLDANNTGSESDFLASLKGADGQDGAQGLQGIPGVNGQDGATGLQGVAGQDGVDGVDGKSAYQIWLDANNTGSESDFLASLKGADGIAPDGTQVGEMLYWNGSAWVNVAPGSDVATFKMVGGIPTWVEPYPNGFVHCGTPTVIVDVINPVTGKTWMDRNLGASQTATSSTDAASYGDIYQWGRFADGHQCRNSVITTTLSTSDTPGHGDFILASSSPYDWRSPQNNNLWQGVNGINNPCPDGYRLPTETELNNERQSWSSNNSVGAFASPLKLPLAGGRYYSSGSLSNVGSGGYYWSSTVGGSYASYLYIGIGSASAGYDNRAHGFSVRCIKN